MNRCSKCRFFYPINERETDRGECLKKVSFGATLKVHKDFGCIWFSKMKPIIQKLYKSKFSPIKRMKGGFKIPKHEIIEVKSKERK